MAHHGRSHDADRPRARDQHVFAQHGKRERRVHRVAERIEDGGYVPATSRRRAARRSSSAPRCTRRSPRPVHADPQGVRAQMPPARQAVAAAPADHVPLAAHQVAGGKSATFEPTSTISPTNSCPTTIGTGIVFSRPVVPLVDVHVRAADGRAVDLDQHVVDADRGRCDVLQPQTGFAL